MYNKLMKKIFKILLVFPLTLLFFFFLISPASAQTYECQWDGACSATGNICSSGEPNTVGEADIYCRNFTTANSCCYTGADPLFCTGSHECAFSPPPTTSINWRALELKTLKPSLVDASIGGIVNEFITFFFPIAGLLLLLYLIYGGYKMMVSAGDPKAAQSAKSVITTALIGFIIIFLSYWIVKIIGSALGIDQITGTGGVFN